MLIGQARAGLWTKGSAIRRQGLARWSGAGPCLCAGTRGKLVVRAMASIRFSSRLVASYHHHIGTSELGQVTNGIKFYCSYYITYPQLPWQDYKSSGLIIFCPLNINQAMNPSPQGFSILVLLSLLLLLLLLLLPLLLALWLLTRSLALYS